MGEDVVVRDGETGKAVIGRTGVFVEEVLSWLASGGSLESLLDLHPGLTREHLAAAFRFAARAVDRQPEYQVETASRGVLREPQAAYGTARGRTVVLDAEDYEALLDRIVVLQGLCDAQVEVARGETVSHEEAVSFLLGERGR